MVIVVALLLLGLFLYAAVQTADQSHRLRIQERGLRAEISQLHAQQAELEGLKRYLTSDEYIEAFARERFGLVFPGEIVVDVDAAEPLVKVRAPGERWWEALFTD
jgi:cell division protein FtsB